MGSLFYLINFKWFEGRFIFVFFQHTTMKLFYRLIIVLYFISCHANNNQQDNAKDSVIRNYEHVPLQRSSVNPNAVKTYREEVRSFETTDQFIVSLYETKETFHYLLQIQYKNLEVEDTLKVPDFGMSPSVEILKGDKRPSCVVGFSDKNKKFRELKLVYFENNKLKVRVLMHYAVATYQDTVTTSSGH